VALEHARVVEDVAIGVVAPSRVTQDSHGEAELALVELAGPVSRQQPRGRVALRSEGPGQQRFANHQVAAGPERAGQQVEQTAMRRQVLRPRCIQSS
jgi:hypothetical protein